MEDAVTHPNEKPASTLPETDLERLSIVGQVVGVTQPKDWTEEILIRNPLCAVNGDGTVSFHLPPRDNEEKQLQARMLASYDPAKLVPPEILAATRWLSWRAVADPRPDNPDHKRKLPMSAKRVRK